MIYNEAQSLDRATELYIMKPNISIEQQNDIK